MPKRISISDIIVGLPAGLVIFMTTVLFSTLLRQRGIASYLLELALLGVDAALVGLLIRVSRKQRAFSTAFIGGLVAALVLLYLRLTSPENALHNPLVFGPAGMVVTMTLTPLTARIDATL